MQVIAINKKGRKMYEDSNGFKYVECLSCKKMNKDYIKPISEFHKNNSSIFGVRYQCKECHNEKCLSRNKKWREENPEKFKENQRKWKMNNPEKHKEAQKEWVNNNRERWRQKKREWQSKNPEKAREMCRKWRENNPDKVNNRKKRERYANNSVPLLDKSKVLKIYDYKCALSGSITDIEIDHVIPLATGHASNTFENIIPLSKNLNASKGDRNIFEWAIETHKRFNFDLSYFYEVMTEIASRVEMTLDEYREYVYWCFNNQVDSQKILG